MSEATKDLEPAESCVHCHSEITAQRLTLRYLLADASNNLFNLERGLLYTFWTMITSPGEVARAFVKGNRLRFMNPFRFLLVAATLTVLAEAVSGSTAVYSLLDIQGTNAQSTEIVQNFMSNYLNIIILLSVPFYAVGSWVVFFKEKWNLAEHLVSAAYAISIIAMLSSVFTFLRMFFPDDLALSLAKFSQLFNLFLFCFYVRTFELHWFKGILKTVLVFIVSNTLAILTGAAALLLYFQR